MPVADGASRRTAVYACNGADACPHTGRAQSNLRGLPDQRPAHLVCEEGCVQPSDVAVFLLGVDRGEYDRRGLRGAAYGVPRPTVLAHGRVRCDGGQRRVISRWLKMLHR